MRLSYVLPIRWDDSQGDDEMTGYLEWLSRLVEVVVVDGSGDDVFDGHRRRWGGICHHVRPHHDLRFLNGKVNGVLTGLREANHDPVVIADDDVRYTLENLDKVEKLLTLAELVLPQNYFDPLPWHAAWDTARILINRAFSHDYPGTLGVRRSFVLEAGGYNGDVLFENLELIRTVKAAGGKVIYVPDLFVRRLPPTAARFWSQRVRQAYDDLAQPWRLAAFMPLLPSGIASIRSRPRLVAVAAAASVALAESGRRRDSGRQVFRPAGSLFAPLWVLERAICVWAAVGRRVLRGGCRYGDSTIRRAATPLRELGRRFDLEDVAHGAAVEPHGLV